MHELKPIAARRSRAPRQAAHTAPALHAKKRDGQALEPDENRW